VRHRRITGLIFASALLVVLAVRHPIADIRILTHDSNDRSPARVQAAIDLGFGGGVRAGDLDQKAGVTCGPASACLHRCK
jgi:hypothetical protein